MGEALQSALGPGAALTGVLLVAGVAAGSVGRRVPHLGFGALAPAAAVAATRAASFGRTGAIVIALVAGALAGGAGWALDRRARSRTRSLPLLADAGVAGFALAVSVIFRPAVFVELPLGPLGGVATSGYGMAAAAAAAGGAVVVWGLVQRKAADLSVWIVATAVGAVAVLLGSGALSLLAAAATPVFTIADTIGLGLRAAAVGFAARRGIGWGVVAAAALGFGEMIARALPLNDLALAPSVVLLAAGALLLRRQRVTPAEAT